MFFRKFFRIFPKLRTVFYKKWNKVYFYANDVKFGRKFQVYDKVYVLGPGKVSIGDDFVFTSGSCLNPICRNICGSIYTMTPDARIVIGNRVGISSACLWAMDRIQIGNDVNIGGDCIIIDNDAHPIDYQYRRTQYLEEVGVEKYYKEIKSEPIIIEDDVWIGARCVILKGVKIGARSIIAAGSVVVNSIPANVIAGGNPCKAIKNL